MLPNLNKIQKQRARALKWRLRKEWTMKNAANISLALAFLGIIIALLISYSNLQRIKKLEHDTGFNSQTIEEYLEAH